MILNKKGDFRVGSWKWILLGVIFLAIGLMPFFPNLFPITFNLTELILKILISVVGFLIIFEAFDTGFDFGKWARVFLGVLLFGAGIWMTLMHFAIVPVLFGINVVILQIIFIIYAILMLIGAFMQE